MAELGLVNFMEDLVQTKMKEIFKSMPDVCQCDRCTLDRMAFALNSLPTKYVVTRKGKLYAKLGVLEGQFDVDISRAVTDAAVREKKNPRHEEDDDL
jgi:competence protein ComFB